MNTDTTDRGRRLELTEASAWTQLYTSVDPATARELGVAAHSIDGASVVVASAVDILAHNRVVGLGLDGPVEDDVIGAIVAVYAAAAARRFFVQVAPHAHAGLPDRLIANGFRYHNDWIKLSLAVTAPPPVQTDLGVTTISRERAREFGDIFVRAFEWPQSISAWVAALVGRPGWRHYLATDGARGVATGAMVVDGDTAWIDFASTLPDYRGRGAQSALVARRIADCIDLGVSTIVVETGDGSASYRNLTRLGFVPEYRRANYILEL